MVVSTDYTVGIVWIDVVILNIVIFVKWKEDTNHEATINSGDIHHCLQFHWGQNPREKMTAILFDVKPWNLHEV